MPKKIKTEFERKLSILVAEELEKTWDKPTEYGNLLENLAFALTYSLCIGYRADPKIIDKAELVIEHYIQEQIQNLLPVAKSWIDQHEGKTK